MYVLQELISEPTPLLPGSLHYIDLIFIDQPNLEMMVAFIVPCILIVIIKLFIANKLLALIH